MKLLLGIDIGSTGCKAVLYDTAGTMRANAYRTYPMYHPQPGWVEEDPDEWWQGLSEAIRECAAQAEGEILAVSVSGTNALIAVDRQGAVLCRAIMQMDTRSEPFAEELRRSLGEALVFSVTGNRIAAGMYSAPSMLWLKANAPEVYRRTWKFLSSNGFIVYRLTGEAAMDESRSSSTMLFDIRTRKWSEELIQRMGLDRDKLPLSVPSEQVVGCVTKLAAEQTGLPAGIPVIAGAQDTVTAAIGAGCVEAAQSLLVVGTVARICVPLSSDCFNIALNNRPFLRETPYLVSGGTNGGGLSMRWFLETFGEAQRRDALEQGRSPYELMDELARATPKGSEGLLYLPYLAAERAPIWDAKAKGVFFGITRRHSMGHFARSVMEGVACAVRQCMELMEADLGGKTEEIRILGGGAKSLLWRQIFADVLNRKIVVLSDLDAETKGAAYMAGIGIRLFPSYAGSKNWTHTSAVIEPDPDIVGQYDRLYARFCALYPALKEEMTK